MTQDNREAVFVDKVRMALDDSAEAIDGATLSRLRQARAQALAAGSVRQRSSRRVWTWVPAGGAALTSIGILSAILYLHTGGTPQKNGAGEELELALSGDSPDLYQELDFYQWLAEEKRNAG